MLCLDDPNELIVQGSYLGAREKVLYISVNRCTGRPSCNETHFDWFVENHFLSVYHNTQKYNPESYGDETIFDDVYEIFLPLDPSRGSLIVEANQKIVVSEEDMLGLHLTPPIEKEFFDFSINRGNIPTRFNSLAEIFITFNANVVIH